VPLVLQVDTLSSNIVMVSFPCEGGVDWDVLTAGGNVLLVQQLYGVEPALEIDLKRTKISNNKNNSILSHSYKHLLILAC
jgi:hypothetical protein